MMTIAYPLRRDEREAVASFLGRPGAEPGPRPEAFCADRSVSIADASARAWNGWSPSRDNTRFVPAALAQLTPAQVPRLKLKWAFGFEGDISAFAQPTVIGNQIFVGSAGGTVHAIRADTGCLQWIYQAHGPIRSGIVVAPLADRHLLLFGDLTGWFYALDAATGKEVWSRRPEEHEAVRLSAPPLVHNGVVMIPVASWEETRSLNNEYACCTFRGSITAVRLGDGTEVWKTYTVPRRPELTGRNATGHGDVGTFGGWSLVDANDRSEKKPALHHHRQQLLVAVHWHERQRHGARLEQRPHRVDESGAAERCIQLELQPAYAGSRRARRKTAPTTTSARRRSSCAQQLGASCFLPARNRASSGRSIPTVTARSSGRPVSVQGGINGGVQWGMASDGELVYATVSDAVGIRTSTVSARRIHVSVAA